jgi:hypothetical protein
MLRKKALPPEYLSPLLSVRHAHCHFSIQPPRTPQRRIQRIRTVGRSNHYNPPSRLTIVRTACTCCCCCSFKRCCAIKQRQKLRYNTCFMLTPTTAAATAASRTQRIYLVQKDDDQTACCCICCCCLKDFTQAAF